MQKKEDIDVTKENILLVIDLLIYHTPSSLNNKQDDEQFFLKANVLNHFSSSQCLYNITYKLLQNKINISQNFKKGIYDINFCSTHKENIENIVDNFLADETTKTQNGDQFTTKIEFNTNINKIIEIDELLKAIKSLQKHKLQ